MPLYAYCVARGIKYTHDIDQYIKRIFIIAFISQIPFMLMINDYELNICFSWLIGLITIKWFKNASRLYIKVIITFTALIICFAVPVDYGAYGLVYLIITYFFMIRKVSDKLMYLSWGILHIIYLFIFPQNALYQVFTIPTIPLIDICNRYGLEKKRYKNKLLEYFYPVHMIVLVLLSLLIN